MSKRRADTSSCSLKTKVLALCYVRVSHRYCTQPKAMQHTRDPMHYLHKAKRPDKGEIVWIGDGMMDGDDERDGTRLEAPMTVEAETSNRECPEQRGAILKLLYRRI